MNKSTLFAGCALFAGLVANAAADCQQKSLAGRWMFVTGIGQQIQNTESTNVAALVTAIGVFTVDRAGQVAGSFDATLQNQRFVRGAKFDGAIAVNADCTGTLTFTTSAGTSRIDSIVVVSPREIRGMSQDPKVLWTYEMRRL